MRRPVPIRFPSAVRSTPAWRRSSSMQGFTLVELLTVVFIISLLIAILVPALSSARTAAKNTVSKQALTAIGVGLEAFRNENGSDFVQTNGYPPSFVHPPIWGQGPPDSIALNKGQFPFIKGNPVAYGAHWLPTMLMGVDNLGYIKPSVVPKTKDLPQKPEEWYTPDPAGDGKLISRSGPYVDSGNLRTVLTKDLPGQLRSEEFFLDRGEWGKPEVKSIGRLPVIVDGFDYPVLYYVANKNGRPTNMVAETHNPNNDYTGITQASGVPFYFHDDNVGFTGRDEDGDYRNGIAKAGWDFNGPHPAGISGADFDAKVLMDDEAQSKKVSFARYILDRKLHRDLSGQGQTQINKDSPLRPVNADSYILWSPGADGKWGSSDDISNMPPFTE